MGVLLLPAPGLKHISNAASIHVGMCNIAILHRSVWFDLNCWRHSCLLFTCDKRWGAHRWAGGYATPVEDKRGHPIGTITMRLRGLLYWRFPFPCSLRDVAFFRAIRSRRDGWSWLSDRVVTRLMDALPGPSGRRALRPTWRPRVPERSKRARSDLEGAAWRLGSAPAPS